MSYPPQGAGAAPTKEFFIPAGGGTELYIGYIRPGYRINADGELAYVQFYVPDDYSSLTQAHLVIVGAGAVTNMNLNVYAEAGADTQDRSTHYSSGTHTITVASGLIYEVDISARLTAIAAGDYVGIEASRPTGGNVNAVVIGVHIKYS